MRVLKKILHALGPGFITGAADDDPTAIATYSQSGGEFGYKQLWTALFITPFMIVIQEMCGRIGMASGKELTALIRMYFPKPLLYTVVFLLLVVNTIATGADIGAMAATTQLLFHMPFLAWILILVAVIILLQLFISYRIYTNILKYTSLAFFAYIMSAFLVKQNWVAIIRYTFVPYISLQKAFLLNLVAILGTNISAYLFFWQTGQEVEEEVEEKKIPGIDTDKPKVVKSDIKTMQLDTALGMIFSNGIIYFIELTTAATLGAHGITTVNTPTQAAQALKPFAGQFSFLLFSIGILGSGFLAIPTLTTSSSYAICRIFKWKMGLTNTFQQAQLFYSLIALLTLAGIGINLLPIKPFDLLVYSAALNGILTPILLVILLVIANNRKIMGRRTNSLVSNVLGVGITGIMSMAALALIYSFIHP